MALTSLSVPGQHQVLCTGDAISTRPAMEYDDDGRMSGVRIRLEGVDLEFTVTPTAYANLLLVSEEGKVAHFVRAMADFTAADGRTGRGWIEWERILD